jgi:hypothetical protein
MVDKISGSAVALDFGKLLGFKRVVASTGNAATLARALGATYNKAGEGPPPVSPIQLARVLGATYNKVGEGPTVL